MAPYALPSWLLFLVLSLLLVFRCKEHRRRNNPILGNLHQLGELPHQAYWQLSKKYGSVMLVKLGRISNVIVSSAEAAKQVLKDHDLARCSRPQLAGATRLSYNYSDVAFTPYGDYWRNMKKLIILELYSLKRVKSFQALREREIELFINSISESAASATPVNLTEKLLSLTANITFKMSFGFDYHGTDFDRKRFPEVVHDSEAVVAAFSIGELIPYVGWILDTFFQYVINDHLKPERKKEQDDVIDVLIRTKKEQADLGNSKFTNNTIKGVLLNLFAAGVDTSAIIVNWAMAELAKNPRVMKKVQNEIRNCYRNHVGKKGRLTKDDIDKLEYLKMVIKETFRLHPAAPLLIPRETISHCNINGYNIYPKTIIQVNVWAIGHSLGQNFEFLPFGAGRRICPGMHMGTITINSILANLLYWFNWKLPNRMKSEDINMEEKAEISLTVSKKIPLSFVPVKYLQ
ncbi:hypothetical protein MANES_13G021201v8 [Manihot esculenta]|uniref:Uncharacterized protein n=1 Tax=Manihot esculenta TaxID=3983 RepID=A0ACB7GIK1_MANES|nr:hypothetical protein MANES_13G021201v8 [Manihot esculenta]